jgi:lipopolysaccharide/colanic/teichoic acid biosynthesis glycosyltransferase
MAKRAFDLSISLMGLVLLVPLFLVVAVLIKLDSPGSVFYRGVRVGLLGKPFRIFKFRTMVQDPDQDGASSTPEGDARITRVGRFLRKYKLDELPQLINVLKCEMSLVGPRPQVPWAMALYSEQERELLRVRPGITDYASLQFANEGELLRGSTDPDKDYLEKIHPEKMRLGLEYVRTRSFLVDCKLVLQTLLAIIFKKKYTYLSSGQRVHTQSKSNRQTNGAR